MFRSVDSCGLMGDRGGFQEVVGFMDSRHFDRYKVNGDEMKWRWNGVGWR